MSSTPTPNASPSKATSTFSESDTSTDNDDPPLYSKATAIQPPPRKRLRTEDDGGKVSSASNLHAPASALLNLPLDVLLEILTHVDPMSLRHVSRTSQALRDTLTGPRSDWIWRASYANTDHGLPSVPNDMAVPQFLSFLVDRVCDFCQECPSPGNYIKRMWAVHIKCCNRCSWRSENMVHEIDMDIFPIAREIKTILGPEYPLHKVFPSSEYHCQPCYREYPRALVERLAAEFSQVADKKAWLIKREKEHENVLEHAGTCSRWDLKQLWKRQAMTKEVREERAWQLRHGSARRYFCAREGDHGHYSIPDGIYDLIHKCEPLADDDWIPIRAWLLHAAKQLQRRMTVQARYRALREAYAKSSCHSECDECCMHPSMGDLVTFKEVTDLIESTSVDQHLTADDMHALIDKLSPARFDAWLASCQSALVDMLNAADPHRARPATTADLHLATSVINMGCKVYWYPHVLRKRTGFSYWSDPATDPDDPQWIVRERAWSAKAVSIEPDRIRLATRLVTLAGLDPMAATIEDVRYTRNSIEMNYHGSLEVILSFPSKPTAELSGGRRLFGDAWLSGPLSLDYHKDSTWNQPTMSQPSIICDTHAKTTSIRSGSVAASGRTNKNSTPLNLDAAALESPPPEDLKLTHEAAGTDALAQAGVLFALPLDVLLEILARVDPLSLRRLSRSSRALRDTLADPSSDWVWRASYASTDHDLPPAPEDISIPKFVDLLVDRTCDFCHALVSPEDEFERMWAARMRCCGRCLEDDTHIILQKNMRQHPIVREVQKYFGRDYELKSLFPASLYNCSYGSNMFLRAHVLRLAAELARDTDGKSREDKKAWIVRRAEDHARVREHAKLCFQWDFQERQWPKVLREWELRKERREASRYVPGVGDVDYRVPVHSTPVEIFNLVEKAELLSEEDWSKMRDWLFEAAKAESKFFERRFCALRQAYTQFLEHKSEAETRTLPSVICLTNWEEVVSLIEGTPTEQQLTVEYMRAFIDNLAEARFWEWREAFEDELVEELNDANPEREQPATTADLALATSVFCPFKEDVLWYDKILRWEPVPWGSGTQQSSYHDVRQQVPWSAREICVEGWRLRVAAQLVSLAGLDPATATYSDMDARLLWFALADDVPLIHEGKKVYLLRWRNTVRSSSQPQLLSFSSWC
ncbi:hypothetical protein EV715DRAFT_213471 [Schizophyllum commune]